MITAIFTDQTSKAMSTEFTVTEQAMIGCNITGDERFTVYREILGGEYEPLRQTRTVQLTANRNEICLAGPKKYKLEALTDGTPISAWVEK